MVTAEDFGDAKVGDLDVAFVVHQDVLQLHVPVGDAVGVEEGDAPDQLLEDAQVVLQLEVFLLDYREQIARGTVLHDVVPPAAVGAESYCFHDVGMTKALGDAVLRFDLLFVLEFLFLLQLLPELLDGVHLIRVTLLDHQFECRGRAAANGFAALARYVTGTCKLVVQLDGRDVKVTRKAGAQPTRFEADTHLSRASELVCQTNKLDDR